MHDIAHAGGIAGRFLFLLQRLIVTDSKERWVKQRREAYEEVMVPWDAVAERVFRQVAAQAEQRLLTILEQELRWELRKAGA